MAGNINEDGGSNLFNLTNVNGILFFSAVDDGEYGRELWINDNTPGGTETAKDIYEGKGDLNPGFFITANGELFFTVSDSVELWKNDGAEE